MRKEATVTHVFSSTSQKPFTQQAASNIGRLLLRRVPGSKPELVDKMITFKFPADTTDIFSSLKRLDILCTSPPILRFIGDRQLCPGDKAAIDLRLTTLGIGGAVPSLSLYAFMSCIGADLLSFCVYFMNILKIPDNICGDVSGVGWASGAAAQGAESGRRQSGLQMNVLNLEKPDFFLRKF
jgi:hypothetical protein